jgi:hypothetical protein
MTSRRIGRLDRHDSPVPIGQPSLLKAQEDYTPAESTDVVFLAGDEGREREARAIQLGWASIPEPRPDSTSCISTAKASRLIPSREAIAPRASSSASSSRRACVVRLLSSGMRILHHSPSLLTSALKYFVRITQPSLHRIQRAANGHREPVAPR